MSHPPASLNKPVAQLSESEAEQALEYLAAEIARHDEFYYQRSQPEIEDTAYDALRRQNIAIEQRFPALMRSNSPTHKVGAPSAAGFAKVLHRVPMLSLGNVFNDSQRGVLLAKPVIAAFVTTSWDLCVDPSGARSTVTGYGPMAAATSG